MENTEILFDTDIYEMIPLKEFDLAFIDIESRNVSTIGIEAFAKLICISDYPISKKKAIGQILSFFKDIDRKIFKEIEYDYKTAFEIHTKLLMKYFSRHTYKKFMNILAELNILKEYSSHYVVGEKSKAYSFTEDYSKDDLCIAVINSNTDMLFDNSMTVLDGKFEDALRYSTINYRDAVLAELDNAEFTNMPLNKLRIRLNKLFSLTNYRVIKKINSNRVYHSFCSISRISREYLRIEGKGYNEIDVKNCQPLLLACLLNKYSQPVDDNYKKDCEDGIFYSRFDDLIFRDKPLYDEHRIKIKQHLYKSILFDFIPTGKIRNKIDKKKYDWFTTPVVERFKKLYPKTFQSLAIIHEYSKDKDTTIAMQLQNLEASVFNNLEVKTSKHYFTLYDAIFFDDPSEHLKLEKQIKQLFNLLGVEPSLKLKIWQNQ
jgi:hypothetical protein